MMNLYQRIKNALKRTKTPWVPVGRTNEGYWLSQEGEVRVREVALTIPAVAKAMTVYKNCISSLPLFTYEEVNQGAMTGRKKATDIPEYRLLLNRPNTLMTRTTLVKGLVDDYWWEGEAFLVARYDGMGAIQDIHRIPAADVLVVDVDEAGQKQYQVWEHNSTRLYPLVNERVIHIIREPDKYGLRGVKLLDTAAEALGLHREILTSSKAFYQNAARPSGWLKLNGRPDTEAVHNLRTNFKEVFSGARNTGDIPALADAEFFQLKDVTAEDARILEALASSSTTVAMVFNLVPSDLGDQSNSKYSSVAADRQDLNSRAMRPVLDTFENAINDALFPDGKYWSEFDTDEMLRGDPEQFARVVQTGITSGYILRSEVRDWMGLEPIEGLDTPLFPLNQGPELAGADADQEQPDENAAAATDGTATDGEAALAAAPEAEAPPVADTALNGAQVASLLAILAQVTAKQMPPETAVAVLKASFPALPPATISSIIDPLMSFVPPVITEGVTV